MKRCNGWCVAGMSAVSAMSAMSVLLMVCVLVIGCGRNDLVRSCSTDSECAAGFVCADGLCSVSFVQEDMSDVDEDMAPPNDMDVSLECASTQMCPGAGARVDSEGMCVTYACRNNTCVVAGSFVLDCALDEVQDGCVCIKQGCQNQSECGDLACVNEQCVPCQNNAQCASDMCSDKGRCIDCLRDEDCRANEVCDVALQECVARPECVFDRDCGSQEACLGGRCSFSPECAQDEDCRTGYECVGNRCFEALCRGPQDCVGDQLCDAGQCVDPPKTAVRCFVATPNKTVGPGQTFKLEAFAVDQKGDGVAANYVWVSTDNTIVSVRDQVATAEPKAGATSITAAIKGVGNINCTGLVRATNLGPSPHAASLRVLAVDAESGRAVPGAQVVVRNQSVMTDGTGVARLNKPRGSFDVSVFTAAYNYVTIKGVRVGDVRVPLNPSTGSGPIAGFSGNFDVSGLSAGGEVTLGLAGASISGGLINFDLSSLLGEPFVRSVQIPTQGSIELPLPGGLVLFGRLLGFNLQIKTTYFATSAGGARLAWGLAGKVPVSKLIGLFQGAGVDLGSVLGLLLPLFHRFDHGLKPLNLQERPRIVDVQDFDGDGNTLESVPDYGAFPTTSIRPSVPQQLITAIDVSNFPMVGNSKAEVAILVGGAQLQAPGFVPLGISAITDENGDGRPDIRRLTLSPPHGASVGGRFAIMAIAAKLDGFGMEPNGNLTLPDDFSVVLWNGQSLPASISLGTFPNSSTAFLDGSRRVFINSNAGPLYRARFVGNTRSWDVWSMGSAGTSGRFSHDFLVPKPPAGRQDIVNARRKILIDAIRTQTSMSNLLAPSGVLLSDVSLVSTGYSRTRIQ